MNYEPPPISSNNEPIRVHTPPPEALACGCILMVLTFVTAIMGGLVVAWFLHH
jgi:hypothetical protein